MRSTRIRVLTGSGVLLLVGTLGWQILPPAEKKRDPITVGTTAVVSGLDPAGSYDAGSWALYSNVYQTLLTFEPGSSVPQPEAAEDCRFMSPALTTYQCTLRDDLTFSNGHKVTAGAVKHSFDRVLKINAELGPRALLTSLRSVTTHGDTVTFNLRAPDATWPSKIATGAAAIVDPAEYPAATLRKGTTVAGSGPYVISSYRKGKSIHLEPNPSYRGAAAKKGLPIRIRYFQDAEHLDAARVAQQVDITHRELPSATLSALDPSMPDTRLTIVATTDIRNLVLNVRKGSPMANAQVRKAVAALVDRERLASVTFRGTVDALYSVIPQGVTGHNTAFFEVNPEPDPKDAEQLLRSAGVEIPVRFSLGFRRTGSTDAEAQELKRQLEAHGLFKVDLAGEREWTKFQEKYADGGYGAYTLGWISDYPDPENFTQPLVGSRNSVTNGYSSKTIDRMIQRTQRYVDRGETRDLFREIQDEVAKDLPLIPLWQRKDYVLSSSGVSGGQYLSDGAGTWRLWELSWI